MASGACDGFCRCPDFGIVEPVCLLDRLRPPCAGTVEKQPLPGQLSDPARPHVRRSPNAPACRRPAGHRAACRRNTWAVVRHFSGGNRLVVEEAMERGIVRHGLQPAFSGAPGIRAELPAAGTIAVDADQATGSAAAKPPHRPATVRHPADAAPTNPREYSTCTPRSLIQAAPVFKDTAGSSASAPVAASAIAPPRRARTG